MTDYGYDDNDYEFEPCKKHGQPYPCQECVKETRSRERQAQHEKSIERQQAKMRHPKKLERK